MQNVASNPSDPAVRAELERLLGERENLLAQQQGIDLLEQQQGIITAAQAEEFKALREQFTQNLQVRIGQQLGAAQSGLTQQLGRRGLTGSGIEQAANIALQQAGQVQFAQTLGEFEAQLLSAQQQELQAGRTASFDFIRNMLLLEKQGEISAQIAQLQAKAASDQRLTDTFFQIGATLPLLF
jgi:hypothetical protein